MTTTSWRSVSESCSSLSFTELTLRRLWRARINGLGGVADPEWPIGGVADPSSRPARANASVVQLGTTRPMLRESKAEWEIRPATWPLAVSIAGRKRLLPPPRECEGGCGGGGREGEGGTEPARELA